MFVLSQNDLFWSAELADLKKGFVFVEDEGRYSCLVCGAAFEEGEVFRVPDSDKWYEARKYAAYHVQHSHGSMLDYLLGMDKKASGLTDLQKQLIRQFASGMSDAEIVKSSGGGSASTIRNHRFVLKEKAKQAKLLLAAIELMESGVSADTPRFMPIHRTATRVDERYAITEDEYESIMKQYFPQGPDGPLASFPRKEKRKVAILRHISADFEASRKYTEKEINEQLKRYWEADYVTLRRYLIEYGFLDRTDDCSEYWVKN
ncbi:DUF2087 domain-containing protein [Paenibacillus algorifonticola]